MRRILVLQSFLVGSVVVITLLALAAGRVLGSAPAELHVASDCQLPCWKNLRPGVTHLAEAANILRSLGYRARTAQDAAPIATELTFVKNEGDESICQVGLTLGFGGLVRELILRACDPLAIGEFFNVVGEPESFLPIASQVIFQEGQTILTLRQPPCDNHKLYPQATIRYISLADSTLNVEVATQTSDLPWQGFVPFWRYGQLHPDKPIC